MAAKRARVSVCLSACLPVSVCVFASMRRARVWLHFCGRARVSRLASRPAAPDGRVAALLRPSTQRCARRSATAPCRGSAALTLDSELGHAAVQRRSGCGPPAHASRRRGRTSPGELPSAFEALSKRVFFSRKATLYPRPRPPRESPGPPPLFRRPFTAMIHRAPPDPAAPQPNHSTLHGLTAAAL